MYKIIHIIKYILLLMHFNIYILKWFEIKARYVMK